MKQVDQVLQTTSREVSNFQKLATKMQRLIFLNFLKIHFFLKIWFFRSDLYQPRATWSYNGSCPSSSFFIFLGIFYFVFPLKLDQNHSTSFKTSCKTSCKTCFKTRFKTSFKNRFSRPVSKFVSKLDSKFVSKLVSKPVLKPAVKPVLKNVFTKLLF